MSALALSAVRQALHDRLAGHAATSGLSWPEEGEAASGDYGRVTFVSAVTAAQTFTSRSAEHLFDVHYFTRGEAAAEAAAEAIDAALSDGPLEVEGCEVHLADTAPRILDESAAGGYGFHAVVTPRLRVSAPATA